MTVMNNGRTSDGKFAVGNPGGPGRPPRATERAYLRKLSDLMTVGVWSDIVQAAIGKAKAGDAEARKWLATYVLGTRPPSLESLAADDLLARFWQTDNPDRQYVVDAVAARLAKHWLATLGPQNPNAENVVEAYLDGDAEVRRHLESGRADGDEDDEGHPPAEGDR